MKIKREPIILSRDGENCFYCEKPFPTKFLGVIKFPFDRNMERVYDHLSNDPTDNRVENLVFAHSICNQQKKNNQAWINKAKTKLRDNEKSSDIPIAHAGTDKETSTETDSNNVFCEIALTSLAEYLQPNNDNPPKKQFINRKEFLDETAGKAYKVVGHASQITLARIVDMFCTKQFRYIKERDAQRKWIIRLRTPKDDEDEDNDS